MRRACSFKHLHASGLTLIEILVGVAVMGVLLAVAAPSMSDLLDRRRVVAATEEVAGILTYAKAETNATNSYLYVRFDPDPADKMSCAVVTTQGPSNCQCWKPTSTICVGAPATYLRLFQLPKENVKFTASASTWAGAANRVRFGREQMTMDTQDFRVDVVAMRPGSKAQLRVELNAAGRVKVCSPNGEMSGYVKCA